jgi:uncharacterized protein YtpQ (UPF0354 family)
MKRLLALFVVVACWSGIAFADALSTRVFTEKVAEALRAKLPQRTITVAGELLILLKDARGGTTELSVANLYHDYKSNPANLAAIVDVYVAGLSEKRSAKLDRARIVPVIKDREWLASNHSHFKASGVAQQHVYEDFNKELVIVYAEDSENRMRYLTNDEDIGVDRKELRKLAVANLLRILPKIEMRQHDDVFAMLTAGGDYEASLLLLDDIWSGDQIKVKGDVVVAVPAKNVVLVTGSQNRKGLSVVRKMAAELASQNRYRLTDTLFVYRDGRFTRFGRK